MRKKLIIAVDGPAGSGKSSTFKVVAQELNYQFIDTGLMYRAFTLLGLQEKTDFNNPQALMALINHFDYKIKNNRIYLNDQDVTTKLSDAKIVANINKVTTIPEIRTMMVNHQRKLATENLNQGLIMVGRDITSVVLPKADLKIYLDSSIDRRAQRRLEQNHQGIKDFNVLRQQIEDRDFKDKNRKAGPLKRTADSWYIDNSDLNLKQTVDMVVKKVRQLEQ